MTQRTANYNLEQRDGGTWYVVLDVPPSLRAVVGRKRLRKSTGTRDVAAARLRRHAILSEFHTLIETARGKARGFAGDAVLQEAVVDREAITGARDNDLRESLSAGVDERAYQIAREQGEAAARRYYDVASGKAVPVSQYHEAWLAEKKFEARQVSDHRLQVKRLEDWLNAHSIAATVQAVTDKVASHFKADALVAKGVNPKTANKWLSSLRSYWRWLVDAGHVERNPWSGKSLPKERLAPEERERAFTDDELQRLISGQPDSELAAAMWISALSGMRLEEIFRLRVRHCEGGIFKVAQDYKGKTAASSRIVPIHPNLLAIVRSHSHGKGPDDFLLTGSSGGWGKTRSMACSKRFTTYRVRLGVDEKRDGARRSLVNFHSFRRWFITKADQAGCRREDTERVAGHAPQGESLRTYSAGMTLKQAKAVVESVQLPAPKGAAPKASRGVTRGSS